MRLAALCVVVVAAALALTAEAHACSCALPDPRSALAQADGAFVGRLVARRENAALQAVLTFDVEQPLKGQLGGTVEVLTARDGAACGIEAPVGVRVGLVLSRRDGVWHGHLCAQFAPADLLAAARPLPAPNGGGPVALLVGGRFGPVRTLALDNLGRTLAYGKGNGATFAVSPCPRNRRMAEIAQTDGGLVLAVRELATLRLVRQRPLTISPATQAAALRCEDALGTRLLVFATSPDLPQRARLLRVRESSVTTLWRGTAPAASLTGRVAYVNSGRRGETLLAVDLRTKAVTKVAKLPPFTGPLLANRTRTRLAGVAYDPSSPSSRLVAVDLRRRPATTRLLVVQTALTGDVLWLRRGLLGFFPHGGDGRAQIYDSSFAERSSFPWTARATTLVGSSVFGLGFDGRLHRVELLSGQARVRRLPSPVVYAIASTAG